MKSEYNDFLIMTPNEMEQIAKKYQEALNKKNHLKDDDYNEISDILCHVIEMVGGLKWTCSKKFFSKRYKQIENIHNALSDIYGKIGGKKISHDYKYGYNYCSLIKDIISGLTEVIDLCLKKIKTKSELVLDECILTCLVMIKDSTSLFGDCKYRSLF